jgi:hypothetical protein
MLRGLQVAALLAGALLVAALAGFGVSILVVAAVAAAVLVHRTGSAHRGSSGAFEKALLRPRPAARRPAELGRLERAVALGVADAGHLHTGLRPRLRAIARTLLAARGVDLDAAPERARSLLGDELWSLVRPDRERPADSFGPGIPLERLTLAVEKLETLQDA